MLDFFESFAEDFEDGKISKEKYPNAHKLLESLYSTGDELEKLVMSGDVVALSEALTKMGVFMRKASELNSGESPDVINSVVEEFTGSKVDILSARNEFKEYAKEQIDKM